MGASAVKSSLTKSFDFSASHAHGGKIFGYNYRLHICFEGAPDESDVAAKIESSLISKIHSRDLGEPIDFLKGVTLEGPELVRAFWRVIEGAISPERLRSLTLERDSRTRWTLEAE